MARNPRNLADDVLAEVGRRGGVVGVNCIPAFLGPGDPIERAVAHHDHIAPSSATCATGVRRRLLRVAGLGAGMTTCR